MNDCLSGLVWSMQVDLINLCDFNADLEITNTSVEIDFATGVHVTKNHHHHHHVLPLARIPWPSLTTFPYRSSPLICLQGHILYLHIAAECMFELIVLFFTRPYVGVHRSTSLISSSLLLQQWPACLVRLAWIVFVIGGRWSYSWCFVVCCRQDLFNIARNILVSLPFSFFSSRLVSVHVVHLYSSIDTIAV